jgi:hypothetical protein
MKKESECFTATFEYPYANTLDLSHIPCNPKQEPKPEDKIAEAIKEAGSKVSTQLFWICVWLIAIFITLCLSGCTSLDYGDVHYRSFLTDRTLKAAIITIDPNGTARADLRGYESNTSEVAGAVAEGFARGMK